MTDESNVAVHGHSPGAAAELIGQLWTLHLSREVSPENSATIFQASVSKQRRHWIWKNLRTRVSEQEHLCCGFSCEGQIDVWELFSDNSYLSANLDRQGLLVAAPIDTAVAGILVETQERESQDRCDVTHCYYEKFLAERSGMATVPIVFGRGRASILGGKHFLILGPESGKIWWLTMVQYLQKKYHCQWTLLRGKKPKWIFHNLGNLLRPLELVPASRERVVPTEWQVRTVFGESSAPVSAICTDQ